MSETLSRSLTSILEQLDEQFEVIVVDDGSTDGSVEALNNLAQQYDKLRVITDAENKNHGEARRHSIELARGDYVLASLDTDDEFTICIPQFISLYQEIENIKEDDFLLLGYGIYMAPRRLLREIPYRSLGYGEDRDLYRRLIAADALISISHYPVRQAIGYTRDRIGRFRIGVETIVTQFESGLRFWPYLRWALWEMQNDGPISVPRAIAHLLIAPLAYMIASRREQYETPEPYDDIGVYKRRLRSLHMTLSQIEERYDVTVDREKLGPRGCAVFDINHLRTVID